MNSSLRSRRRHQSTAVMDAVRRRLTVMRREADAKRVSALASHVSGSVHSATMPLRRLLARVKTRLTPRRQPSAAQSEARLARLKFCVWSGAGGWSIQRRYLLDEAQFVWLVGVVNSVAAWEDDGLRPGDVLETIGGDAVGGIAEESDVLAKLKQAPAGTILRFRVRSAAERCRVQRFDVKVDGSPAGVAVVVDGEDAVPIVIRVSTPADTSRLGHARLGDVLTEVNGKSVVGVGIKAVTALVAASRHHMTLTFLRWMHTDCGPRCRDGARMVSSRPSTMLTQASLFGSAWRVRMSGDEFHDFGDDETEEFQTVVLVWRSGPLGVTLMKDDDAQMPVVNRLTGKGTVQGVDKLRPGYHLASINGTPTHRKRFRDVLHDLERSKKPLWLVFLAPHHRVSMYSTSSRVTRVLEQPRQHWGPRWSSSSSLLSLDDSWDARPTKRYTSTGASTFESVDE